MSRGKSDRNGVIREITQEVRAVAEQISEITEGIAERLGVNSTDQECLGLLLEHGALTAGALAQLMSLTTGAITGVIDRLERAGFVRRENDPHDRRRVIIRAIKRRNEELSQMHEPLAKAIQNAADRYKDEELDIILDFLVRCNLTAQETTLRAGKGGQTEQGGEELRTPLTGVTSGRLVFSQGASSISIRGDRMLPSLYSAHFDKKNATIDVQGEREKSITIKQKYITWRGLAVGEVILNGSIPWHIIVSGGSNKVVADLREVRLASIELTGGVSEVTLTLPRPTGAVPMNIAGGLHKVAIHRPPASAVRLHMAGGVSNLTLDGVRHFRVGNDMRWETPGAERATDVYNLEMGGGLGYLTLDTRDE